MVTMSQIVLVSLVYAVLHIHGLLVPVNLITTMVTPYTFTWLMGAVCGDWKQGLIIGAVLQTINMTPVIIGAITTVSLWYSAAVVIPMVIVQGLSIDAAIAVAAPIAVAANFLDTLETVVLLDLIYTPMADKAAAEGDWHKLMMVVHVLPAFLNTLWSFIAAFIGVSAATAAASAIITKIPESVMLGFNAASSIMPAVGFALFLALIGKMKFLPFFFVGFYCVKYLGLGTITIGILGVLMGFIYLLNREGMEEKGIM